NIINRLAEYSITDLQIDSSTLASEDDEEIYLKLLDKLDIKSKLIEIAKTYFATGNAFASIDIKFKKHFKCPDCGIVYPARVDNFGFKKNKKTRKIYFTSKCENSKCKYNGRVETIDIKIKKPENIKVKIWDWHDIDFNWNPISDEYMYYYKVPSSFVENVRKTKNPDPFLLISTPQDILEEIFKEENLFSNYSTD